MPLVHIEWFPGRTVEQKRELAATLTRDICRIALCLPESVEIVFTDVATDNWAQGGELLSE